MMNYAYIKTAWPCITPYAYFHPTDSGRHGTIENRLALPS